MTATHRKAEPKKDNLRTNTLITFWALSNRHNYDDSIQPQHTQANRETMYTHFNLHIFGVLIEHDDFQIFGTLPLWHTTQSCSIHFTFENWNLTGHKERFHTHIHSARCRLSFRSFHCFAWSIGNSRRTIAKKNLTIIVCSTWKWLQCAFECVKWSKNRLQSD